MPKSKPREWRDAAWAIGIVLGGGLLVLAATMLGDSCERSHASGKAAGAIVVAIPGGRAVLFFDDYDSIHDVWTRVTSVDAATGKVLGKRLFEDVHGGCAPAGDSRVWCRLGKVALYDARTLATIDDTSSPGADAGSPNDWGDESCETQREAKIAGDTWSVGGGSRSPILRGEPGVEHENVGPSFFAPLLLEDSYAHEPLVGADGPVIVFGEDRRRSVARVGADGRAAWTVDLGGACVAATIVGDSLVVATTNAHRVLGIDLVTGEVRWRAGT
jgi:outer membrane protein assembly factor BamB